MFRVHVCTFFILFESLLLHNSGQFQCGYFERRNGNFKGGLTVYVNFFIAIMRYVKGMILPCINQSFSVKAVLTLPNCGLYHSGAAVIAPEVDGIPQERTNVVALGVLGSARKGHIESVHCTEAAISQAVD